MDQPAPALTATSGDVTGLLLQSRHGDPGATERLFPLVYEELRRVAHAQLRSERPGHTLGTTALVHETYLRLVDQTRVQWRDRGHFLVVASWAMRRILLDYARRNRAARRGGGTVRFTLDADAPAAERGEMLLALDEALERLARLDRRLSQVVECRYFGGLTEQETAEALGVTRRTVQRDWAKARGWLCLELNR
jgi:RNA polymerase sigma-70 factor, ECF subfamily